MVIATKESRCAGCEQQMRNKHAAFIPSRKKMCGRVPELGRKYQPCESSPIAHAKQWETDSS